jgi:hypothetical protein
MISADEQPAGSALCAICRTLGTIHYGTSWTDEDLKIKGSFHFWFCLKHYNEFTGSDLS